MIIYLFILAITLYLIYRKYKRHELYGKYNLKGRTPLPFIGNFLDLRSRPFYKYEISNYKKFGKTYVDYILSVEGTITTCDPEIAKRILVKDFYNFQYRVSPGYLPKYARKALIFMHDDWKRIRSQLSPVFTSSRLKLMFTNFDYPIENCLKNIDELIDAKKNENVEVKKLMRSFSLDIIGNVVFSLKTNAYKDDEFSRRVIGLFAQNIANAVLSFLLPSFISKFFDLSLFDSKTVEYFAGLTLSLIEDRKKNKDVVYNDFIELLLKSEAEGSVQQNFDDDGHIVRKLSTEEIVAACLVFFLGGMETVSNALIHVLLELSLNPEIQEKLHEDLMRNYPTDDISYEDIGKSKYLDNVIKENIRMHLALNRVFRVALGDLDFGEFKVTKGQVVGVSIYNIHHNPELFPDPYKFRPDRFNGEVDENTLYMPFSIGPRNCIAERFALLELKSLIIRLVKRFKFSLNEQTMNFKYRNAAIVNLVEEMSLKIDRR